MNTENHKHQLMVVVKGKNVTHEVSFSPDILHPNQNANQLRRHVGRSCMAFVAGFKSCMNFLHRSDGGWLDHDLPYVLAVDLMDHMRDQVSELGFEVGRVERTEADDDNFDLMLRASAGKP